MQVAIHTSRAIDTARGCYTWSTLLQYMIRNLILLTCYRALGLALAAVHVSSSLLLRCRASTRFTTHPSRDPAPISKLKLRGKFSVQLEPNLPVLYIALTPPHL